jgi:hypothetical protein
MLTQCGGTLTPTVAYDLVVNDGYTPGEVS